MEAFATYQQNGSGWMLKKDLRVDITLSRLRPLRGSSHVELPKALAKRRTLINMANKDEECSKWAVTRALNPVDKDPQRVAKLLREQAKELCWDGVKFPTPCSERVFRKFEENNDISPRVFGHQPNNNGGVTIIPLYAPKERREMVVRLFFLKSEDGTVSHYCVVKNMSAQVSSQVSKKKAKKYVCDFCLCSFGVQRLLDAHTEYCSKHDAVKTVMPVRGRNTLKFKNIQNAVECPIKIYADFESFLKPIDEVRGVTRLHQRHVPSAFCLYVVSRVEGFSMDPITYVCQGEDDEVDRVFVQELEKVMGKIYETFKEDIPIIFDEAARELHESQDSCYACGEKFDEKDHEKRKVRDHCYFTGKYRGALHAKCNLRLKKYKTVPVFFHNLTGYDSHIFVKRLADSVGGVRCIPRNEEKYITFSKEVLVGEVVKEVEEEEVVEEEGEDGRYEERKVTKKEVRKIFWRLKFVDTLNFMKSSLEKLAGNLKRDQLKHLGKYFRGERMELMCGKGIYPYGYMTGVERLRERSLPPKEEFASLLNEGTATTDAIILPSQISEKDYQHAQKVFKTFGCEDLAGYTVL